MKPETGWPREEPAMTFDLHYGATPSVAPAVECELAAPPALRLLQPETGQIDFVVEPYWNDRTVVRLSDNGALFFDLWFWSLAVAWGLMPVAVRLEQDTQTLWLSAQPEPDGHLRLGLMRTTGDEPIEQAQPQAGVRWRERRNDLVRRLGAMWDSTLPSSVREAMAKEEPPRTWRRQPGLSVADVPALESPPWPLPARVAWFYLLLAQHVRLGEPEGDFARDPVRWTLSLLSQSSFTLDATRAAWCLLHDGDPPGAEVEERILALCEAVRTGALGYGPADKSKLLHAYMEVNRACRAVQFDMIEAIRPRLPVAPGSHVADAQGRRATVVEVRGHHWLLAWEDGRLTHETWLAGSSSNWRWPVAHGPRFDRASLDPIDQRRLRFLALGASPVGIVCPVCGYPSTDDDWVEVQDCDVCGFRLDEAVDTSLAEDLTETDEGQWLTPRINEARERFRRTTWSGPEDEDLDPASYRAQMRDPRYRALVRDYMAEWDAWLVRPAPKRLPLEMWRRWNRLIGYPD